MSENLNPEIAARHRYDKSVADYRRCIAASPPSACEGQKAIMENDARVLAAAPGWGSQLKNASLPDATHAQRH
jgi:hypothetical protein